MVLEDIPLLNAVGKISEHPVMAWILAISVLMLDAGIIAPATGFLSLGFNHNTGLFGGIVSFVLNLLGFPILVTSFQLLVIVVAFPLLLLAIQKSPQVQRR